MGFLLLSRQNTQPSLPPQPHHHDPELLSCTPAHRTAAFWWNSCYPQARGTSHCLSPSSIFKQLSFLSVKSLNLPTMGLS